MRGFSSPHRASPLRRGRSRRALRAGTAKDVANWCIGDVLAYLNESGLSPEVLPLAPDGLAELVDLVADGTLSRGQAKDVLAECLQEPKRPKQVVEERGLAQLSDEGELGTIVDTVLAGEPRRWPTTTERPSTTPYARRSSTHSTAWRCGHAGQGNPQLLKRLFQARLGGN